ncbi:uncharacterized protein LOC119173556 isoform X1 [Rhipicephalus microplus]|uniref:uncharacterized protein LOC119173556 isoform X1 n=1 Tax=Rhipicephalus microplus TaxID=6941 RepID=UPI003F6C5ADA
MRKRCDVVNCPNGRGEAGETGSERGASWPSYHLLPRLEPRRSLWLDAVTFRSGRLKARRVCSLHFRPEDYTFDPVLSRSLGVDARAALNPDAVPSLLLGHEQQIAVPSADNWHKLRCTERPMRPPDESFDPHNKTTQANVFTRTVGVQGPITIKKFSTKAVQTSAPVFTTFVCHCKRSGRGAWCGSVKW